MIFPPITISTTENLAMKHMYHCDNCVASPEAYIREMLGAKIKSRKMAIYAEWKDVLTSLTGDLESQLVVIIQRSDFLSKVEQLVVDRQERLTKAQSRQDTVTIDDIQREIPYTYITDVFNRRPVTSDITLFTSGIEIDDVSLTCLLHYVDSWEHWVYGAILGYISKGKTVMLRQYQQVLFDDPTVVSLPATEEGQIQMITERDDYLTIPQQLSKSNIN